jgi:PAS domain S-box-containing protein
MADGVSDAAWLLDRDLRVVAVNARAEELGGVPAAEIVGRDIRAVFPDVADSERAAAALRVAAGGPAETLRLWHRRFGAWTEFTMKPDPEGVLVIVQNVDRIVEAESRAHLEAAVLDSVGEGIYGVDADNHLTFMNAAAQRLLGYDVADLLGRDAHEALHHTRIDGSPYPAEECAVTRTLGDGRPRDNEDVLWRSDGTGLAVSYHSTAITDGDRVVGAVVSFRDITDRLVAAQAEIAAAAAEEALFELQQVLQPPPPSTDDPRLGVYYLPADAAGAGGDLYDWQAMPDDGLHVAVVDVVGKGVVAARDALAVTHALKLLVLAHTPLDQVVRQASWLLADAFPDLAATAVVAHYERGSGLLRFVSAGHPPPLVVAPGEPPRYAEASGRAIGWPDAGTDDVAEVLLRPGGRVILYTDGLIEGTRDVLEGMHRLAALADAVRDLPAAAAAQTLVTRTLEVAQRRDDCLAIVIDRPAG